MNFDPRAERRFLSIPATLISLDIQEEGNSMYLKDTIRSFALQ